MNGGPNDQCNQQRQIKLQQHQHQEQQQTTTPRRQRKKEEQQDPTTNRIRHWSVDILAALYCCSCLAVSPATDPFRKTHDMADDNKLAINFSD